MRKAVSSWQIMFWSCLAFYVVIMAAGIDWFDSPELAQAAFFLDGTHPPGQPLYVLLAKCFNFLPFGTIAWRSNLFSACCCAAAVTLLTQLVPSTIKTAPRFLLFALLALQPAMVLQVVRTEVYGLHLLMAALCIVLVETYLTAEGNKKDFHFGLLATAFVFGLGLTNHHFLMLLLTPYLLWRFLQATYRDGWSISLQRFAWVLGFVALGLTVYLFLPIRASAGNRPPLTWGETVDFARLIRFLRGEDFKVFFVMPWQDSLPMLRALAGIGWWLVGATLLSLVFVRQKWPLLLCMLMAFVGCTVTVFYTENPDSFGYIALIPLLMIVLLAQALTRLPRAWQQTVLVAGILMATLWHVVHFPHPLLRNQHHLAANYVNDLELNAPTQALFLLESDHAIFPLLFSQYVERSRPDIVYVGTHVFGASWYRRALQRQHPELNIPMQPGTSLADLVQANRQRPLFAETIDALQPIADQRQLPATAIHPWGHWYYLQPQANAAPPEFATDSFTTEYARYPQRYRMTGQQIQAFVHMQRAKYQLQVAADLSAAIREVETATDLPHQNFAAIAPSAIKNLPLNLFLPMRSSRYRVFIDDKGHDLALLTQYYLTANDSPVAWQAAEVAALQASQLDNPNGLIVLADAALKKKQPERALAYLQSIPADFGEKNLALGIVYLHLANLLDAEKHLLLAIRRLPADPGPLIWLAWLRWQQNDVAAAEEYFAEAVRRFPNDRQVLQQQADFKKMVQQRNLP